MNASCSSCSACGQRACTCARPPATPLPIWNRPGLPALRYRVGTHSAFMAAMQARLANITVETLDQGVTTVHHPLQGFSSRSSDDPAIALLDGWACIGEVLSFYQERIANEGYLRTAQERRSVLEMARLVGYALRPGVAASVFLAYTLDDKQAEAVDVPIGTRAQSIPGPGEQAQSFETSEKLVARTDWNNLRPRLTKPQDIRLDNVQDLAELYLDGTQSNLKSGSPLLFEFADQSRVLRTVSKVEPDAAGKRTRLQLLPLPGLLRVMLLAVLDFLQKPLLADIVKSLQNGPAQTPDQSFVQVILQHVQQFWLGNAQLLEALVTRAQQRPPPAPLAPPPAAGESAGGIVALVYGGSEATSTGTMTLFGVYSNSISDPQLLAALNAFETDAVTLVHGWKPVDGGGKPTEPRAFIASLLQPTVLQAPNSQQLARSLGTSFAPGADSHAQLLFNLAPPLREHFYSAWVNAELPHTSPALKTVYAMRANLALFGASTPKPPKYEGSPPVLADQSKWTDWPLDSLETGNQMWLENVNEAVFPGSLALLQKPDGSRAVFNVSSAATSNRTAYGISGKCTQLKLVPNWWNPKIGNTGTDDMSVLRSTLVLVQSEALMLSPAPVLDAVPPAAAPDEIELDGLYKELYSGRWIILAGERADIPGVAGVRVAELLMISALRQEYNPDVVGDSVHTTLKLATPTAYRYKRDSITIYANVVRATHGESRIETLGSGDGAASLQSFTLKQAPLTFVSANNPQGVDSTLKVLVDNIEWHEADSLNGAGPHARQFISKTADDGTTSVQFGNGVDGARLPSGVENVQAQYRQGIGLGGNVRAGQISLLMSRPLGVKEVINPLRASGGAPRESRDQARENVPLAVMALDRLVALQDYADFARTFAGIGKASVARLSDGRRELIHLTIAGALDAPVDETSDLYRNLLAALRRYGDPALPLAVQSRELTLLIINARIKILPDYQWEDVESRVRRQLLDTFSFERRQLGQSALLCEVIAAMQNVAGVAYVDVDNFGGVPEKVEDAPGAKRRLPDLDELATLVAAIQAQGSADQGDQPVAVPTAVVAKASSAPAGVLQPAQLLLLTGSLPDTLILNQIL